MALPNRQGSNNANWRGGKLLPCSRCAAPVWVKPSDQGKPKHFCSLACARVWMKSLQPEETKGWKGGGVKIPCTQCGSAVERCRAEHARRNAKYAFCSRLCYYNYRRASLTCPHCKNSFEVPKSYAKTRTYCSRRCKKSSQIRQRSVGEIAMRKLNARITTLIGLALRGQKAGRSWQTLVGYTLDDLRAHLESQFAPGMSWENIGEWHIDHRRPRSSFSFADHTDPQFLECWSLANLQPLWALDNLIKGARIVP